jgi:hypothetical protein
VRCLDDELGNKMMKKLLLVLALGIGLVSSAKATFVGWPGGSVTGNFTAAGQSVAIPVLPGIGSVQVTLGGGAVGLTYQFQGSPDGTSWVPVPGFAMSNGFLGAPSYLGAGDGTYMVNPMGSQQVRVNSTAYTSGTETVVMNSTTIVAPIAGDGTTPLVVTDHSINSAVSSITHPAAAANPTRHKWFFENRSTDICYFNDNGTASSGVGRYAPPGYKDSCDGGCSPGVLDVYCPNTYVFGLTDQ